MNTGAASDAAALLSLSGGGLGPNAFQPPPPPEVKPGSASDPSSPKVLSVPSDGPLSKEVAFDILARGTTVLQDVPCRTSASPIDRRISTFYVSSFKAPAGRVAEDMDNEISVQFQSIANSELWWSNFVQDGNRLGVVARHMSRRTRVQRKVGTDPGQSARVEEQYHGYQGRWFCLVQAPSHMIDVRHNGAKIKVAKALPGAYSLVQVWRSGQDDLVVEAALRLKRRKRSAAQLDVTHTTAATSPPASSFSYQQKHGGPSRVIDYAAVPFVPPVGSFQSAAGRFSSSWPASAGGPGPTVAATTSTATTSVPASSSSSSSSSSSMSSTKAPSSSSSSALSKDDSSPSSSPPLGPLRSLSLGSSNAVSSLASHASSSMVFDGVGLLGQPLFPPGPPPGMPTAMEGTGAAAGAADSQGSGSQSSAVSSPLAAAAAAAATDGSEVGQADGEMSRTFALAFASAIASSNNNRGDDYGRQLAQMRQTIAELQALLATETAHRTNLEAKVAFLLSALGVQPQPPPPPLPSGGDDRANPNPLHAHTIH